MFSSKPDELPSRANKTPRLRNTTALELFLAIVLLAVISLFTLRSLSHLGIWTDEAATILTAFGWPGLGEPVGGISDALGATTKGNADVGGYTLGMWAWVTLLGESLASLRGYAIAWFIAYLLALIVLFRRVTRSWLLVIVGIALMLLENQTLYYAAEIRPYGAGLASSVGIVVVALWFRDNPSGWRATALVVTTLLLGSHIYVSIAILLGTAGFLAATSLDPDLHKAGRYWILGTVGLLISYLPLIYVATRNALEESGPPAHVMGLLLSTQGADGVFEILRTNFGSFTALPRTLFLVLVPLLIARRWIPRSLKWSTDSRTLLIYLWVFVAVGTATSAALSVVGAIPWVLGTRWSITDVGLIAVSLAGLLGIVARLASQRKSVRVVIAWVALAVTLVSAWRITNYERPRGDDYISRLLPAIAQFEPNSVVIDKWILSDMRYLIEFSGRYTNLRESWLALRPRESGGSSSIGQREIEAFLDSEDSALVLDSRRALDESGITLPRSIQVKDYWDDDSATHVYMDYPILLLRDE